MFERADQRMFPHPQEQRRSVGRHGQRRADKLAERGTAGACQRMQRPPCQQRSAGGARRDERWQTGTVCRAAAGSAGSVKRNQRSESDYFTISAIGWNGSGGRRAGAGQRAGGNAFRPLAESDQSFIGKGFCGEAEGRHPDVGRQRRNDPDDQHGSAMAGVCSEGRRLWR